MKANAEENLTRLFPVDRLRTSDSAFVRVDPGDTSTSLARQYDMSVLELMRLNALDRRVLKEGAGLVIPNPPPPKPSPKRGQPNVSATDPHSISPEENKRLRENLTSGAWVIEESESGALKLADETGRSVGTLKLHDKGGTLSWEALDGTYKLLVLERLPVFLLQAVPELRLGSIQFVTRAPQSQYRDVARRWRSP
jgi:LysM repeat protein